MKILNAIGNGALLGAGLILVTNGNDQIAGVMLCLAGVAFHCASKSQRRCAAIAKAEARS